MPNETLQPERDTAVVRLYGQGLGDCFLLSFPREGAGAGACHVVIDCGIAANTPDEEARMRAVVEDLHAATGGRIDVLVVTHEHYDHVSGFYHERERWKDFKIGSLWLPWTDRPGDADAGTLKLKVNALNEAAANAVARALLSGDADVLAGLRMQAGFLGVEEELVLAGSPFAASAKKVMAESMAIVRGLDLGETLYCEPGEVRRLPGTEVDVYVLGPPRPQLTAGAEFGRRKDKPLVELLEDERVMYGYADIGLTHDQGGSGGQHLAFGMDPSDDGLASGLIDSSADGDRYCPFDRKFRIPWDEAMPHSFFRRHYVDPESWRRVDDEWLGGAPDLALRAGGITNNISLVLAFELPGSKKILLFPGDAQVGNWLSWHRIETWKPLGEASPRPDSLRAKDLLARVTFYKVGHHGSHNATIKQEGLELMGGGAGGDLIAYISVSVPVAHDVMNYCPMPFYPVVRRLQEKAEGRVLLGSGEVVRPADNARLEPLTSIMQRSTEQLPAKVLKGVEIESPVPLWVQLTFRDA